MNSHRMVGALIVCCILVGYIVLESRLFFLSLCPVGTLAALWFRCVGSSSPGATQASPPHIHTSPAFTGRFFMKPPWKPDAPLASVASAPDSFSSSPCLCPWVSCAQSTRWAMVLPENSRSDSLAAGARPPGSAVCLAQNNSRVVAAIASWRYAWQYAAGARLPVRYTSLLLRPALPRSPPIRSPRPSPPTSALLARDPSSWFDATAIPHVSCL